VVAALHAHLPGPRLHRGRIHDTIIAGSARTTSLPLPECQRLIQTRWRPQLPVEVLPTYLPQWWQMVTERALAMNQPGGSRTERTLGTPSANRRRASSRTAGSWGGRLCAMSPAESPLGNSRRSERQILIHGCATCHEAPSSLRRDRAGVPERGTEKIKIEYSRSPTTVPRRSQPRRRVADFYKRTPCVPDPETKNLVILIGTRRRWQAATPADPIPALVQPDRSRSARRSA